MEADTARSAPVIVGIVAPVLWLLAALVSLLPVAMSVMMFDAPGSEDNELTIALFASLASFPILAGLSALATPALAFAAHRATDDARHRLLHRVAWVAAALPLGSVAATVLSVVLLAAICGGSFTCR